MRVCNQRPWNDVTRVPGMLNEIRSRYGKHYNREWTRENGDAYNDWRVYIDQRYFFHKTRTQLRLKPCMDRLKKKERESIKKDRFHYRREETEEDYFPHRVYTVAITQEIDTATVLTRKGME